MTLQEIIDHEKDNSYTDGVRAGVQQGLQQGIIRTYQKLNQTKEKTIEALMQECGITVDKAKEYISLYWQDKQ